MRMRMRMRMKTHAAVSVRKDEINHALFIIPLFATDSVPVLRRLVLVHTLGNLDVRPCYSIVHGKRSLQTKNVAEINKLNMLLNQNNMADKLK